jgi:hypothetical protein
MRNKTIDLDIGYKDKLISNILHTKFLGIIRGSTLSWSNNIELLTKKLSTAFNVIRPVKPRMSESAMKMIYHSLFHSILSYGIILWVNSSQSITVFKIQKKVITVMMGFKNWDSCSNLWPECSVAQCWC